MKHVTITLLAFTLISMLLSCSPNDNDDTPTIVVKASNDILETEILRIADIDIDINNVSELVENNNEFSFSLYRQLKNQGENVLFSPYSISSAIAMISAGAKGSTEKQIFSTLHFNLPQTMLHSAFNWLDIELNKRGSGAHGKDTDDFELNIINALWGQKNYEYNKAFLDTLKMNYGAGLRIVDFSKDPEKSRNAINDWIREQSNNKITEIASRGINKDTRLVLTNAVYLNAAWLFPFSRYKEDISFHRLNDSEILVSTMYQNNYYNYKEGNDYQAIEILYDGNELSMIVIMPKNEKFRDFENDLNFSKVKGIINNLTKTHVIIKMPSFSFQSQYDLSNPLTQLGMIDAFDQNKADFSGITTTEKVIIDSINHRSFVIVDIEGTEAAAITSIAVTPVDSDPFRKDPIELTINRPFFFLVRDIQTGTILFLGRVMDPSQ